MDCKKSDLQNIINNYIYICTYTKCNINKCCNEWNKWMNELVVYFIYLFKFSPYKLPNTIQQIKHF